MERRNFINKAFFGIVGTGFLTRLDKST